jgi:hypothetical protein
MAITHTLDPIVDPERLFEGFENLMPFRVGKLLLCGRKVFSQGCAVEIPCDALQGSEPRGPSTA